MNDENGTLTTVILRTVFAGLDNLPALAQHWANVSCLLVIFDGSKESTGIYYLLEGTEYVMPMEIHHFRSTRIRYTLLCKHCTQYKAH